jgi:ketosteroid isomerase-like protein
MSNRWIGVALGVVLSVVIVARAQTTQPAAGGDEALHNELRQLRDELVAAVNKQDIEGVLKHCHPEIVYTPQDARTMRGHQAIRDYFNEMMNGPDRIVESLTVKPTVDELTFLFADSGAGVAYGGSEDTFRLTDGRDFTLRSRWTGTVMRDPADGQWKIIAFHISGNLFDNALLDLVKRFTLLVGIGAFVVGALLVAIIAWLMRRKRPAATT